MSRRWYYSSLRGLFQSGLKWVESREKASPRKDGSSFFGREVHLPTPMVTAACAAILFLVLLPETHLVPTRVIALIGFICLMVAFFVLYFRVDFPEFVNDDEAVFLTGLLVVLGAIFIQLGQNLPGLSIYGVPLGAIAILATMLLHLRVAFLITVVLSLMIAVLNEFSFDALFVSFFASVTAMLTVRGARHRGHLWRAGFAVIAVTAICLYLLSLFNGWPFEVFRNELRWAVLKGVLCAIIPLGLLPIFESFFSRITNITLLEMGDFNRPLLRRLMVESPGTYHHTLMVAALAESAAEAIGANSLLCRVGMYYHDVGKLVHPEYFIENQTMRRSAKEKPVHHDKLNPSISSLVIMSHVKEGVALARSYKVPEEIARFIPEHHGTSLIRYFYMRALEIEEAEGDTPPAEESYRYPGPKPHSKETVIGMLADSVEAASRTIEEPTYDRLKDLVTKIVNGKFTDGQFDESPITLADLRKIIESFAHTLSAMLHVRIEYPEMPNQEDSPQIPPEKTQAAE